MPIEVSRVPLPCNQFPHYPKPKKYWLVVKTHEVVDGQQMMVVHGEYSRNVQVDLVHQVNDYLLNNLTRKMFAY